MFVPSLGMNVSGMLSVDADKSIPNIQHRTTKLDFDF